MFYFFLIKPLVRDVKKVACIELAGRKDGKVMSLSDVMSVTDLMNRKAMPVLGISYKYSNKVGKGEVRGATVRNRDEIVTGRKQETLGELLKRLKEEKRQAKAKRGRGKYGGKSPSQNNNRQVPPVKGKSAVQSPSLPSKLPAAATTKRKDDVPKREQSTAPERPYCSIPSDYHPPPLELASHSEHTEGEDVVPIPDRRRKSTIEIQVVEVPANPKGDSIPPSPDAIVKSQNVHLPGKAGCDLTETDGTVATTTRSEVAESMDEPKALFHPPQQGTTMNVAHSEEEDRIRPPPPPKLKSAMKFRTLRESLNSVSPPPLPADHSPSPPLRRDSMSSCSGDSWTDLEGKDAPASFVGASTDRRPKNSSSVLSWGWIEIREYQMSIGDNPACVHGVPIQLNWEYETVLRTQIDGHELEKPYRPASPRRLSTKMRLQILLDLGYSPQQLKFAIHIKNRDQQRRIRTVANLKYMALNSRVEDIVRQVSQTVQ